MLKLKQRCSSYLGGFEIRANPIFGGCRKLALFCLGYVRFLLHLFFGFVKNSELCFGYSDLKWQKFSKILKKKFPVNYFLGMIIGQSFLGVSVSSNSIFGC